MIKVVCRESAKSFGLRGNVGYVGPWVRGLRGSEFKRVGCVVTWYMRVRGLHGSVDEWVAWVKIFFIWVIILRES